ncbi:envoplakin a [Denticeps clupeoides]|uniref:Envoplakin n=1 Tax=Denticeps clupeoides TaxID=299321 RepID=A0AAY4A583_9TELE|nr:envoplakin [Denticeps clupeoides]
MFKKKDSTLKDTGKAKSQVNNLALVIARMQKNADQVEKDVLRAEELLLVDAENEKSSKPFQHQKDVSDSLAEAEGLLKDLFLDVDRAKKMGHPQAGEIENDVSHLHERWLKDCTVYRDVYEPVNEVELLPRIDWAQALNQKQRQLNTEEFGPTLADVEKQIAAHNILHKEIEAYNSQMSPGTTSSKEEYAAIKKQYTNLLDNSKWRRHYLNSLYEYMQGCKKEMTYLQGEEGKILKQDWSDLMVDPMDVRRQYEIFKNNNLLSHETEVNKLQDDGEHLLELKHPANRTIQAQRDAVRKEWEKFLNLCICQETHLDNVQEFKKYQHDAESLSESLSKLGSGLEPKALKGKTNTEILLQLESEEKTVQQNEQLLADLRKRSTTISPLKLRRSLPSQQKGVESLCDWSTPKASLARGEPFTLKSNGNNESWEVQSRDGSIKTFPGVCFSIPPPDPEAIDKVDLLGSELAELKNKRAALLASLKNQPSEVSRPQQVAKVSSAPVDPKATELTGRLDKLDKDLAQAEQGILNRLRTPLDRSNSAQDLAGRLKDQEKAAEALQALKQQKESSDRDLSTLSKGALSTPLSEKLNAVKNKQDCINSLNDLYTEKARSSLNLENQIKKVDGVLSNFEKQLSKDGTVSDAPKATQIRLQEIQNLKKDVAGAQPDMQKLSKDLETTEKLCSSLQQGYQEFCPDIGRQRAEATKLQSRYANVGSQVQEREKLLQEAAIKNQDFQNVSQSLSSFLDNLPNNKISPTDNLAQINAKQASQERVVEDIKRKGDDIDRVMDLSLDLQDILQEYETNCEKYNSTVNSAKPKDAKKPNTSTLSDSVQKQEKALVNRYAKTAAESNQMLGQMGLVKKINAQNEEKVNVVTQQQVQQQQSQQKSQDEVSVLQEELQAETAKRSATESELGTFKTRLLALKNRRGVERLEEKEVLQYYRDPKMVSDLEDLQNTLHKEALKRAGTQSEIELLNKKITSLERDFKNTQPKLVTREVTETERDPQLDVEATKLKEEIKKMKTDVRDKDGEMQQMKTEVVLLEQKKPSIKQRVVQKEVVKIEKDPEMLKAVRKTETDLTDEGERCRSLNSQIFQTRSQINILERLIPTLEPKVVTKELKRVERDPEAIKESQQLRSVLEEERSENVLLGKEVNDLQVRHSLLEKIKPKMETKEIINEIYRISPEQEKELAHLKREIQDSRTKYSNLEQEIRLVKVSLDDVKAQKPQVEWKEVIQDVVKEERSPENAREIQRLSDQVTILRTTYKNSQDQLSRLIKERDEWKAEKSKVETKIVSKEVVNYVNDPLLEKEADRLRREVREETQRRRTTEELVFDLQNKYIQLERQKPEEKVVIQEVVNLQKDPQQKMEHERLERKVDDEISSRRQMDLDVQQLRAQMEDKQRTIKLSDEPQKRVQAETELRLMKERIYELETAPPPIEENIVMEEVLKVERDPKLDKLTIGLRGEMDTESNNIIRLQRDIRNLTTQIEILQREKSGEKTIYKEVIRVEKDRVLETERYHLRDQVLQETHARRDLEDEIRKQEEKLNRLQSKKASTSQEEVSLIQMRDALQREKENLQRELRTLESEKQDISVSFQQQARLMSERTQVSRQKGIKMESDIQHLERDILDEKDKIYKCESTIRELQNSLKKENSAEMQTKETNVSTRITILDPETGKDMSPYQAFTQGLIDRVQYLHLQDLECDWEELTAKGPEGEVSVLQDRKSGKQYSIKNAVKEGKVTPYQMQQYRDGKMSISEFALLVAGDTKTTAAISPAARMYSNSAKDNDGEYPIAGIYDSSTNSCLNVRAAAGCKLVDTTTAQKLLEAQAATGGIIDLNTKERYSVHKAAELGLIDSSQLQRLLNAQKAFTGVEDPITRERLCVGVAVQKGWMPKDTAMRYMEAQFLTGGLVDPNRSGRIDIVEAVSSKMIDGTMQRELQVEGNYPKELTDPVTKERISYKQAMARSKIDPQSGLLMLPASSKDSGPTYYSHRIGY